MEIVASINYDRFRPIGVGQGMNSSVYFAVDPQLGGDMAVKEISKATFANDVNAYFEEARATFKASHPNVVKIQYACYTANEICLAMPYYSAGSLADRIKDRPLALTELLRVAQGVLAGMAHIHTVGYVHFDIKPANVLFSETETPMIADFGQARTMANGIVTVDRVDAWLVPPETIVSRKGSVLSDVYQAGLLLYSMLNGDDFCRALRPDKLKAQELIQRGKFPDRQKFLPHVPKRLRTVVRKAIDVDPTRRFQSATEMADVLSRVPVDLDWQMEPITGGGRRWTAKRPGCANIIVEQLRNSSLVDVCTYTEKPGEQRRAKERNAYWRSGLSDADAMNHLKTVFEGLLR